MYNTKQKKLLDEYLLQNKSKQFSANDIISSICPNRNGSSTIYRLISKMVSDGTLVRISGNDGKKILYQYAGKETYCSKHFHLRCTKCGQLIHLDCPHLDNIGNHLKKEHNFSVDTLKTVFYGLCSNCQNN